MTSKSRSRRRRSTGRAFAEKYGPWALVAGASEGLGAAFARELGARGLDLILVARRRALLETLAAEINTACGVRVSLSVLDLASASAPGSLARETEGKDVGLLVYNAAYSLIGPFFDFPFDEHEKELYVNCRGPLALVHHFGGKMCERGRGGIVLLSSMAAYQGSPLIAHYGATKAYNLILAEGLWDELRGRGVDVLASCAGATRTPNYEASAPRTVKIAPPIMEPEAVARESLAALGKTPTLVPGFINRIASFFLHRLVPRKTAIATMGKNTRAMYGR